MDVRKEEGPASPKAADPQAVTEIRPDKATRRRLKKQARAVHILTSLVALRRSVLSDVSRRPKRFTPPLTTVEKGRRKAAAETIGDLFDWWPHWPAKFGPHNVVARRQNVLLARKRVSCAFAHAEGFTVLGYRPPTASGRCYGRSHVPVAVLVHPAMRMADALDEIAEFGLDAFAFPESWLDPSTACSILAVAPDYSAAVADGYPWAAMQLTEHWPVRVETRA